MTREIDELREVFLRMAERYDESANVQDTGSPVAQHNIGGLAAEG